MELSSDLIYDAALDDELFAQLPSIVAQSLGARSCVMHWRDQQGDAGIFGHSGYFPDAEMENYAVNFTAHDLWTEAGMRQGFVNRAWRTSDLVPANDYAGSVFFNEWIRAMGDDTFHCCGSVMKTLHGDGIIGLHRGRTQRDFGEAALGRLNDHVSHLRRMFAIRSRIDHLARRNDLLGEIFAHGGQPSVLMSRDGAVMMANPSGDALLRDERFLRVRHGRLEPVDHRDGAPFDKAVALAFDPTGAASSDCLIRSASAGTAMVTFVPIKAGAATRAVLVTIDEPRRATSQEAMRQHLHHAYGLSAAEADVALRLGDGQTVQEIGHQRSSTSGTVRFQVKQILSKLGVRRQADVVRLIAASPSLPRE